MAFTGLNVEKFGLLRALWTRMISSRVLRRNALRSHEALIEMLADVVKRKCIVKRPGTLLCFHPTNAVCRRRDAQKSEGGCEFENHGSKYSMNASSVLLRNSLISDFLAVKFINLRFLTVKFIIFEIFKNQ